MTNLVIENKTLLNIYTSMHVLHIIFHVIIGAIHIIFLYIYFDIIPSRTDVRQAKANNRKRLRAKKRTRAKSESDILNDEDSFTKISFDFCSPLNNLGRLATKMGPF